jgi:hypothetical protein
MASTIHASTNNGCGPSWVALVVNAIGNSPYWSNTAVIVTWDDWGGWYDHVAPPILNSYEYGFRVPMLVISPYAKLAYISHATHDFGSILKFAEATFGLPSLGYADVSADDHSDIFNFSQTPIVFQTIAPPPNNIQCLSDNTAPTDPDDDGAKPAGVAQQVPPPDDATGTEDCQGRNGAQAGGPFVLDDAPRMGLRAGEKVRFARGTARTSPWCAVKHRVIDWASRSSSGRSSK